MKKPVHVVVRHGHKNWLPEIHDKELKKLAMDHDPTTIGRMMGFSTPRIQTKLKILKITAQIRKTKPVFTKDFGGYTPVEKLSTLELGKTHIHGYNPATGCIHLENNRVERLPIIKLIERLTALGVM